MRVGALKSEEFLNAEEGGRNGIRVMRDQKDSASPHHWLCRWREGTVDRGLWVASGSSNKQENIFSPKAFGKEQNPGGSLVLAQRELGRILAHRIVRE